ncbi:methionyl-tRNA formyltransferase [Parahaliea mediterranea]|uniref:Methionyl-tRNA formyltransferase n=1 Tax=Parahaliea mediterranea TaxID=651086 RepID=A0A939DFB4_9GAMM|nr:methionyl-tRNA formyltransferase [Parahaliea mediterranea]MBN7797119.1 methionyl-tRNA formyltransferase [Parahaliea mediterranea]
MPQSSLRLIFAGTPDFAAHHLEALLASEHEVIAVYTQPDRPAGRGKKLQASPVKQRALAAGLPVRQPPSLRDADAQRELAALDADAMIVVAYGLILPQAVLDAPRLGCLNVHASLLPRWRGAAPIQRAIEAGDAETGVTIMQMDAGLDTGAMLTTARCGIGPDTTAASLHDTLAELGAPCLLRVLEDLPGYRAAARPQDDGEATYAAKILKPEARLDWRLDAATLDRKVRAFNPFPVCFSELDGQRVKVWRAQPLVMAGGGDPGTIVHCDREGIDVACGDGRLRLQALQLPGGRTLDAAAVLNARGEQFAVGARFALPDAD